LKNNKKAFLLKWSQKFSVPENLNFSEIMLRNEQIYRFEKKNEKILVATQNNV